MVFRRKSRNKSGINKENQQKSDVEGSLCTERGLFYKVFVKEVCK